VSRTFDMWNARSSDSLAVRAASGSMSFLKLNDKFKSIGLEFNTLISKFGTFFVQSPHDFGWSGFLGDFPVPELTSCSWVELESFRALRLSLVIHSRLAKILNFLYRCLQRVWNYTLF
jgi:hypothetical protein